MKRISTSVAIVLLFTLSCSSRAEDLQSDAAGFPSFAVARLSIAKMGVFMDQTASYANKLVPNIGALAKAALANALFKLPVDESLNFEGPAHIYVIPPLTWTLGQETASILPVSNAEKLKKNIASVFGEATEKDGVLTFVVEQPIPLPDKTLLVKIVGNKALLAPNASVLKQLEAIAVSPDGQVDPADATLTISMSAVRKLFDSALIAGALLASESVEGLNKVAEQLDAINKTLWQIGTLEARLSFDKDQKNANAELAIVPLKGSRLDDVLANPPPGLEGKNSGLLALGSPINAAARLNGKAISDALKKFGIQSPAARDGLDTALLDIFDGESAITFDSPRMTILQAQHSGDPAVSAKKMEALQKILVDMVARAMNEAGYSAKGAVYAPVVETVPYKSTPMTIRKIGSHEGPAKLHPMVHDENGFLVHTHTNGLAITSAGFNPDDSIKRLLDAPGQGIEISPDVKAEFDSPPPGTLVYLSVQVLEVASMFAGDFLGENTTPDQIVGGLSDVPVALSVFALKGKAGIRASLPGVTARSLYITNLRLKRRGINMLDVLGSGGNKKDNDDVKVPGNIPAPPAVK